MKNVTIGSSIICMDHINFQRDVELANEIGIDYLHLDVMDGAAVPRYGIYPEIVQAISKLCDIPMDLHLMVDDIEMGIEQFSDIDNIEYISFHYSENKHNILSIVDKIREKKIKAGIVFNLSICAQEIVEVLNLEKLDSIMLMGIHPGILKQTSRPENVIKKLEYINNKVAQSNIPEFIQVDGGVSFDSIPHLINAGANNLVCGSSTLYKSVDLTSEWSKNEILIKNNFKTIKSLAGY